MGLVDGYHDFVGELIGLLYVLDRMVCSMLHICPIVVWMRSLMLCRINHIKINVVFRENVTLVCLAL